MSASPGTAPPPTFVLPPQSSPSPAGSPPPPDQINPTPPPRVATPPSQSPPPALTSPPPPTFSPPLGPPPPAPPSPLTPSDPPIFPPRSPAKPPGIPESPYPPPPTTIPLPGSSPPPPQPPRNAPPPPTTIPSPESSPPPPRNAPPPPTTIPSPESSPPPPQPPRKVPAQPETSPPPPQPPRKTPAPPESSPPPPQPPRNAPPPPQNSPPPNSEPQSTPSPPPFPRLAPPSFSPPISSLSPPSKTNTDNSTGYSDSPNNSQSTKHGEGIGTAGTAAITSLLSLLLLGLLGAAACCVWKRKRKSPAQTRRHIVPTAIVTTSTDSDSGASNLQRSSFSKGSVSSHSSAHSTTQSGGIGGSRSGFTYDELVAATNGFPQNNLLGEGGFGSVYKGRLPDGREVAVKQLKIGARQGEREFRSEVDIISRIHHRHLVSLLGYCVSENTRLLVYEYVPNNTLYFHLHGQGRRVMNWATRVKIAMGAARGIAYLHEDCHPRVIHRDIKSSNILLDYSFDARVSDFGLAKLAMDCHTHVTTRVMGTFGYMAPEYASSGKLTEKSDVYSFGVVLLELITGRKPVDTSQPLGEESLVEWARPLLSLALDSQEFGRLADPRLEENYVDSEMLRMVEAAAACIRHSSTKRPQMGQIVGTFDSMVTKNFSDDSDESEIFISAPQSEEDTRMFEKTAFRSEDYSTDYFSQNSWTSRKN